MRRPIYKEGNTVEYYINTIVDIGGYKMVKTELHTGTVTEIHFKINVHTGETKIKYKLDNLDQLRDEGTLMKPPALHRK